MAGTEEQTELDVAPTPKKTTAAPARGGIPMAFGGVNRYVCISTFHKYLRKGDFEQASYWLHLMIDGNAPKLYLVGYLWQVSAEELAVHETDVADYLAGMRANVDKVSHYHLYYGLWLFCKATKWWDDETSCEIRRVALANAIELHDQPTRKVPHFAHDKHTTTGLSYLKAGTADRRWEGTWVGMTWRQNAAALVRRFGAIFERDNGRKMTMDDVTWEEGLEDAKQLALLEHVNKNIWG